MASFNSRYSRYVKIQTKILIITLLCDLRTSDCRLQGRPHIDQLVVYNSNNVNSSSKNSLLDCVISL